MTIPAIPPEAAGADLTPPLAPVSAAPFVSPLSNPVAWPGKPTMQALAGFMAESQSSATAPAGGETPGTNPAEGRVTPSPPCSANSRPASCWAGLFIAFATSAGADDTAYFGGYPRASEIVIRETAKPGALAEVWFHNAPSNDAGDTGQSQTISLGGLSVAITFAWNVAGDRDEVTITPPEGVMCLPSCVMEHNEGEAGTVWLYAADAVGM